MVRKMQTKMLIVGNMEFKTNILHMTIKQNKKEEGRKEGRKKEKKEKGSQGRREGGKEANEEKMEGSQGRKEGKENTFVSHVISNKSPVEALHVRISKECKCIMVLQYSVFFMCWYMDMMSLLQLLCVEHRLSSSGEVLVPSHCFFIEVLY